MSRPSTQPYCACGTRRKSQGGSGRCAEVYICASCRRADRQAERDRLTPKAVAMYEAGASTRMVAERLGVGHSTVRALLLSAGVQMRPPRQPAPLQRRAALDVRVPEPERYADDALEGGRWVNDSGIQRWRAAS